MKFSSLNGDQESFPMLPAKTCSTTSCPFLIHKAAKEGSLDVLQQCIEENKTSASLIDDRDMSPLHYAAQHNRVNAITALIKAGVDVNVRGEGNTTALHIAARYDSLEATEALLSNDANTSIRCTINGSTPLLVAVRMENPRIVECLLTKKRGLVEDIDLQGMTALHLACMRGSFEICKILIQYGASLSKRNNEGCTPIVFAAGSGDESIMALLIDEAKNQKENIKKLISSSDEDSTSPLLAAINAGKVEIVRLLTENEVSVNTVGRTESTPLHMAALNGNVDIVNILIDKGAIVDAQDAQGKTPLHRASSLGWMKLIRVLINHKAALEIKDEDGMTPLLSAILSGHVFAVKVLVSLGADVMACDNERRTSLHIATINEHFLIMHILLSEDKKKLQNIPDNTERIPLHYAAFGDDTRILTTLIEHGSDCFFKDRKQATPLHVAAGKGTPEHVELILKEAPCSIHERDSNGNTALHLAALIRKEETCAILLRYGADVDCPDSQLQTPLFYAARSGSLPIIELLLDRHANPNHNDSVGNTALHIAAEHNNPTIAMAFLDKGVACSLNHDGYSCLDIAIASRASEVINTILRHQRWEELVHVDRGGCEIMSKLINDFPEGALLVMDKSIRRSKHKPNDPDFSITFDFQLLDPGPDRGFKPDPLSDKKVHPVFGRRKLDGTSFYGLQRMVERQRQDLLVHPLASRLRRMKWKSFGALIYCLNFLMFALFAILLTIFMLEIRGMAMLRKTRQGSKSCQAVTNNQQIVATCTFVIVLFHLCKELFQMYIQRLRYFTDAQNLLEICTFVFGLIFILPYTFKGIGLCTGRQGVVWRFGTVAIFLAYFNLILLTRTLSFIGLYVTMFMEVFRTLLKVMVMCILFILAFALVFYILFKEQEAFEGFGVSVVKVLVMTIGELDYNTLIVDAMEQNSTETGAALVPYPEISYLFIFFFVMAMPIVLMNLLVGLAVGDIEAIQKRAFLTRIGQHVEFLTDIEKQYPKIFLRKLYTPVLVIFPRRAQKTFWKYWLHVGRSLENFIQDVEEDRPHSDPIEQKIHEMKDEMSVMKDRMKTMMQTMEHQNQMLRSTLVTSRSSITEDATPF